MNYLEYTNQVPMYWPGGELVQQAKDKIKGLFSSTPKDSYDETSGIVTLNGNQYNTNDKQQVAQLQDYLISKGHNLGVSKGNGNFGKNTRRELQNYLSGNKPAASQQVSSEKIPTFEEYMYRTGANYHIQNYWDEAKTLAGSILGIDTSGRGEGTTRQLIAATSKPVKTSSGAQAIHYDQSKKYLDSDLHQVNGIGQILTADGTNLGVIGDNVVSLTIGENDRQRNPELREQTGGWDIDKTGLHLIDGTDYHMITIPNPDFDPSKPIDDETNPKFKNVGKSTPKEYEKLKANGSLWKDIFQNKIYNPVTLFENEGTRRGWHGGRRVIDIPAEEIQKYKDEYQKVISDPKLLAEYRKKTARFGKNGFMLNYLYY